MVEKPGWTRLNFSYLMAEDTVRYILDSVSALVRDLDRWAPLYALDPATGQYHASKNAA